MLKEKNNLRHCKDRYTVRLDGLRASPYISNKRHILFRGIEQTWNQLIVDVNLVIHPKVQHVQIIRGSLGPLKNQFIKKQGKPTQLFSKIGLAGLGRSAAINLKIPPGEAHLGLFQNRECHIKRPTIELLVEQRIQRLEKIKGKRSKREGKKYNRLVF